MARKGMSFASLALLFTLAYMLWVPAGASGGRELLRNPRNEDVDDVNDNYMDIVFPPPEEYANTALPPTPVDSKASAAAASGAKVAPLKPAPKATHTPLALPVPPVADPAPPAARHATIGTKVRALRKASPPAKVPAPKTGATSVKAPARPKHVGGPKGPAASNGSLPLRPKTPSA